MAADDVARVVADISSGHYLTTIAPGVGEANDRMQNYVDVIVGFSSGTVVDGTAIYRGLIERERVIDLYEDHPSIAPPWTFANICYENDHGNVIVMATQAWESKRREDGRWDDSRPAWGTTPVEPSAAWDGFGAEIVAASIAPEHDARPLRTEWVGFSWSDVRWVISAFVFVGGFSHGQRLPTRGPFVAFQHAVGEDGQPLDLHWAILAPDLVPDITVWDMAHLVHLGTLAYMNLRNVELVEPRRPRSQRRRIERTGLTVKTLHVRPLSRRSRKHDDGPSEPMLIPLTPVAGHWAHYGACCATHEPRGLLFGKLTGRYFVPPHARGSADVGEVRNTYHLTGNRQEDDHGHSRTRPSR